MKSDRIKNWPPRERPRERLIAEGPERLSDAELLAIILRVGRGTFKTGVSGQSATELARQLLVDFKGWRGLDRAFTQDLMKVPGLSRAKVAQIKAALEIGKRLHTKRLTSASFDSSAAVAAHLRPRFLNARHESVYAVLLDGENKHLDTRLIAEGTPTEAAVYIRRVLEEALKSSAAAIVIVHNHPSGDPAPTPGDDALTQDLLRAFKLLGLLFLDHIIIGESSHYSYADNDRLEAIQNPRKE
jgi:DNA repair protein RadC